MSSIASRYEAPNSYHHVLRTGTRNGPPLASPADDESPSSVSPSPLPRTRMTSAFDSVNAEQLQQKQLIQQMNSANRHQQRDKKRNISRYRRSATLSPAAGARRNRGRYERTDSSDSDGEDGGGATYPLVSPAQLASASWIGRRPSNLANSKRSASPLQATSAAGNRIVQRKPDLPRFARSALLRKTCSEPTDLFVDECDRNKVEKIQDILNSLDFTKFHLINKKPKPTVAPPTTSPNRPLTSPLSPSNSQSSYASGRSSPLVTPSQSPDETWATPRGSLFVPPNHQNPDRPSPASLALTRLILKGTQEAEHTRGGGEDDSDFMSTDIEELREAAQTIEALSRRNRRRPNELLLEASKNGSDNVPDLSATPIAPQMPLGQLLTTSASAQHLVADTAGLVTTPVIDSSAKNAEQSASNSSLASSSTLPRRSGITTRLGGQPRGVMQFLPSVKSSDMLSKTAYESYLANKTRRAYQTQPASRNSACSSNESSTLDITSTSGLGATQLLRRKVSMPEQLYQVS